MFAESDEQIQNVIRHWVDTAEQDHDTARILFESGRYVWSLFLAHLVLEKLLKALWVAGHKQVTPPRSHNLLRLAELCCVPLSDEDKTVLLEMTEFNIEARYPDIQADFYTCCTKDFAAGYLDVVDQWQKRLKEQLKNS